MNWSRSTGSATSLDREQAIWVSGFFAGMAHRAAVGFNGDPGMWLPGEPELDSRLVTILFGSETGNGKELATSLAKAATAKGLEPRLVDMADYKLRTLREEQDLLVVTAPR